MATVADIQTDLDAAQTAVVNLKAENADLKAQLAAGSLATQADLDEIDGKVKTLTETATAA